MDTTEGQKKVLRMAKETEKNSKDIYQSKVIKDEEENVLVQDFKILERWREYYQKLMNEHNPREGRNEQQAEMEGDITEITSAEIEMALRNMKNGKAAGPDNLPIEVWKSLGRTGVNFLKEALNKITDEEKIPDIWRKSILIPIFKNKGDIMNCGNYLGIKLMCHSMNRARINLKKMHGKNCYTKLMLYSNLHFCVAIFSVMQNHHKTRMDSKK